MAAKRRSRKKKPTTVESNRHDEATRANIPRAKIAAEGQVPLVPKAQYRYSPRRPPELRFDPDGKPDALPELLEEAKRRRLTDDEAKLLAEALRNHEPWLEWAEKQEQHDRRGGGPGRFCRPAMGACASSDRILEVPRDSDDQYPMIPEIRETGYRAGFDEYVRGDKIAPLFLCGDALEVLQEFPDESVDFCMTSPPYWGHRQYATEGIGGERDYREYVSNLMRVFAGVRRVLKRTGSFWLNLGDSYKDKRLLGIPWRVALELTDSQGWVLRNDVIWHKVKGGPDNARDKLGNVHEYIFHFVKQPRAYYYDVDSIRLTPKKSRIVNGAVVSATGVTGVRYRRQIELSTALTEEEKAHAYGALEAMLRDIAEGKVADFRMIIRGQQRTTHSDSKRVSGRARELEERGFYFLRYHPDGCKPRDVWDILPEDTQKRKLHFAPYPEDLCKTPLVATCPTDGVALDPFCGTGTTMLAAFHLDRKSVGIDVSREYLELAAERCRLLF